MASQPPHNPNSLYPEVIDSNPDRLSPFLSNSNSNLYPSLHDPPAPSPSSSSSKLYPTIDMSDLLVNLFPDKDDDHDSASSLHPPPVDETLIRVPGAILHLIDDHQSVELSSGDFSIVALRQGDGIVAALARVGDAVQWPLAKDEVSVRLDESHYFFSLHVPKGMVEGPAAQGDGGEVLNYGITFASKGQEALLNELDRLLEVYSSFSVQSVAEGGKEEGEVLVGSVARGTSPGELMAEGSNRKEEMERESSAYWTTLAPNVEEYSSSVARAIARGSGKLIKGILWCGDVTVDRLKWGNDFLKRRVSSKSVPSEVSPETLKRIQRAKRVSKMSEKVANGILSGVVKVSGIVTSSIVNSKAGKKFFGLLPGEIVLATLDGFGKICDAVEVAGKSVMSTSSTVTTELVSHRYGEKAAEATQEGLHATGHAFGTAWAVFKIRKALNPKSAIKPSTLAKSALKAAPSDVKDKNN